MEINRLVSSATGFAQMEYDLRWHAAICRSGRLAIASVMPDNAKLECAFMFDSAECLEIIGSRQVCWRTIVRESTSVGIEDVANGTGKLVKLALYERFARQLP